MPGTCREKRFPQMVISRIAKTQRRRQASVVNLTEGYNGRVINMV